MEHLNSPFTGAGRRADGLERMVGPPQIPQFDEANGA